MGLLRTLGLSPQGSFNDGYSLRHITALRDEARQKAEEARAQMQLAGGDEYEHLNNKRQVHEQFREIQEQRLRGTMPGWLLRQILSASLKAGGTAAGLYGLLRLLESGGTPAIANDDDLATMRGE